MTLDHEQLTFILQGPTDDQVTMKNCKICFENLIRLFPKSFFIISTWNEVKFTLPARTIWINADDPGEIMMGDLSRNANRQLQSVKACLKNVNTRYICKIRNDILVDERFKLYLQRYYKDLNKGKVFAVAGADPRVSVRQPYTVSDWLYIGKTERISSAFSNLIDPNTFFNFNDDTNKMIKVNCLFTAEQYFCFQFIGNSPIENKDHCNAQVIAQSFMDISRHFRLLAGNEIGLRWLKHPGSSYAQRAFLSDCGLMNFSTVKLINDQRGKISFINKIITNIQKLALKFRNFIKCYAPVSLRQKIKRYVNEC